MFEPMTDNECARIIAREFHGDEELALAFGSYCLHQAGDRGFTERHPVPECSLVAWDELADGTIRHFACLADYQGLVAVYRLNADGPPVLLEAWPQWLLRLDLDPAWMATCRRLEANMKRRQRRRRKRLERLVAELEAADGLPTWSNDNRERARTGCVAA